MCRMLNDAEAPHLLSILSDTHTNIIYMCQDHLTSQLPLDHWGFPQGALGLGSRLFPKSPQCSFPFSFCFVFLTYTLLALTLVHASKLWEGKALENRTRLADLLFFHFWQLCKGNQFFLCERDFSRCRGKTTPLSFTWEEWMYLGSPKNKGFGFWGRLWS